MKKIQVKIPQYWVVTVQDYHEFDSIQQNFHDIGIKVKYEEVGLSGVDYEAVFWVGKKPVDFIKEKEEANGAD